MVHQMILIPAIGKFVTASSYYFKLYQPSEIPERLVFVSEPVPMKKDRSTESLTNLDSFRNKNHTENRYNGNNWENPASLKERNGFLQNGGGNDIVETNSSNGHLKKT